MRASVPLDGLATLARAAAMQCSQPEADPQLPSSTSDPDLYHSRPATPNSASHKRQKQNANIMACMPGPDLAPIRFSPSLCLPPAVPDFPSMPSMSEISSLAGSGCTCGVQCACPGCVEHTASENYAGKRRDCGEGCGACIDPSIGVALPNLTPNQAKESTSFLDRFFARAAALPPPPPARRKMTSYNLDPMNTGIYASTSNPPGPQLFTFGAINLPKLGTCPTGQCTSRVTCVGSCLEAESVEIDKRTPSLDDSMPIPMKPPGSCCGGSV